jgi:hypothetical protein
VPLRLARRAGLQFLGLSLDLSSPVHDNIHPVASKRVQHVHKQDKLVWYDLSPSCHPGTILRRMLNQMLGDWIVSGWWILKAGHSHQEHNTDTT